MNYENFKEKYSYTLAKFPQTDRLFSYFDMDETIGVVETINYEKRGNNWVETYKQQDTFAPAFYFNTLEAMPFFRNWGGYEHAEKGYTYYGFLPFKITSINPWRDKKTVRIFRFEKPF